MYFFPSLFLPLFFSDGFSSLTRPRGAALPIRRPAGGIATDLAFLRWAPFARSTFLELRRITDETGAGGLAPVRGFAARPGKGSRTTRTGTRHDTTQGARTPTRSRDVTAARGDVDVNRGRDARNHDDRRTDRTIVRDRFSALLFLSLFPFSSSRVFISTVEVSANRRPPSCFLAIASGTDRNGATAGRTDAAQLAARVAGDRQCCRARQLNPELAKRAGIGPAEYARSNKRARDSEVAR